MQGLVLIFYPLGCLAMASAGWGVLRIRPNHHALSLSACRALLLLFPFLLVATAISKPFGPSFWMYLATPLPGRRTVVAAYVVLVGTRWLGELTARQAFKWRMRSPDLERRAPSALLTALDVERLQLRLAPPWWLAWMPRPEIFLSKAATAGHLTSGLYPRICLDASLVPERFRAADDLWWQAVLPAPDFLEKSLDPLRAVLVHELAHFKRADHLRTFVRILTGALLPWEWLFGQEHLGKYQVTSTWLFRRWSRFMTMVGMPMSGCLREEKRLREVLADEEAEAVVTQGHQHLQEIRELYPQQAEPAAPPSISLAPPALARSGLFALAGLLLWASPGRIPCLSTLGDELMSTRLPGGWCLTQNGKSTISAVFIPAQKEPGRVLVDCSRIDPCHPPEFRAVGRQRPDCVPDSCRVELVWDVGYFGTQTLTGKEAVMSLTQSAGMVRTNHDLIACYTVPMPLEQGPGPRWARYRLATKIHGHPAMDILYICYTFSAPGRYVFRPPVMTIVLPDGERRAYPDV